MNMHAIAAVLAGLIFFAGQLVYYRSLRALLNHPTDPLRPRIVSWIIWLSVDAITVWGMWVDPRTTVYDLGQITSALLSGLVLFAAMLPHIQKAPPRGYEYACLLLAGAGIVSSTTMESQTAAVAFAQLGGLIGSIPTFISVRENPKNEPALPWFLYLVSTLFQSFAIKAWTWPSAIQLGGFTVMQCIIVYYTLLKPRLAKTH